MMILDTALGATPHPGRENVGAIRSRADRHRERVAGRLARVATATGTTVLCLVAVVLLGVVVGGALGYRSLVIKSGSMTPTIGVGSIVVSVSVHPLQVKPGAIVTFRDLALGQQLVTHRVVQMHQDGQIVAFVTKGDANHTTEHWTVPVTGTIGREVLVVPDVGRWMTTLNLPLARVIEILATTLLLAFLLLRWIWFTPGPALPRGRLSDDDPPEGYPTAG
jgi:signal peptidase